jgi:hypothetical protein
MSLELFKDDRTKKDYAKAIKSSQKIIKKPPIYQFLEILVTYNGAQ